jgi:hypothetical protein
MIGIFTLAVNSETNEASWTGTLTPEIVLGMVQELVIRRAAEELTKKQVAPTIAKEVQS